MDQGRGKKIENYNRKNKNYFIPILPTWSYIIFITIIFKGKFTITSDFVFIVSSGQDQEILIGVLVACSIFALLAILVMVIYRLRYKY